MQKEVLVHWESLPSSKKKKKKTDQTEQNFTTSVE